MSEHETFLKEHIGRKVRVVGGVHGEDSFALTGILRNYTLSNKPNKYTVTDNGGYVDFHLEDIDFIKEEQVFLKL